MVSIANGVLGRSSNQPGAVIARPLRKHPSAVATTTTTTIPPVIFNRDPSAHDPLRLLVLGDSLGIDLGNVLVNDLSATGVVQATLDGQVATGLTRPDYFNWPGELSVDLPRYTPQVIVVMIGANDAQDLPGPPDVPFGTSAWLTTYGSRVSAFMTEATSRGAKVLWVGMPPMQDPGRSSAMQTLNGIVQAEARSHRGVTYVSSWTLLGSPSGQFTPYLLEGGQEVNVREPDGTHIAPGGAQVLSVAVEDTLHRHLGVRL